MLDLTVYVIEMVVFITSAIRLDKPRELVVFVKMFPAVKSASLEFSSNLNQGESVVRHPVLFLGEFGCKLEHL